MKTASCLDLLRALSPGQSYRSSCRSLERQTGLLARARQEYARLGRMSCHEQELWQRGEVVAGCDEVGRGPMAGPLVACAVCFAGRPWIPGLKDSKKLGAEEREQVATWVRAVAVAVGLGVVEVPEIDCGNLHRLSLEAMRRALASTELAPRLLLVDGRFTVPGLDCAQRALVKGDGKSVSVAAASVVAKVYRDAVMVELDREHPGYGFAGHKGYVTPEHLEALRRLGPSPVHRASFAPVRDAAQRLLF